MLKYGFKHKGCKLENNDGENWWQWMVKYNFNDAPGVEVGWYRN